MTVRSPKVAFGLLATTAALKAKTGTLKRADKVALCERVDLWCAGMFDARVAVDDFLEAVDSYPLFAADRLQDFARALVPAQMGADDALPVLDAAYQHAAAQGWTTRKDCGHD